MKFKIYKALFLIGLLLETIGQMMLYQGSVLFYQPIDFAHWCLLLGVVLLIPQVISFPDKVFSYLGIPVVIIGIVSIIGMCVIDFTLWSYQGDYEARSVFFKHIHKVTAVWKPFMKIGPPFLNVGLLLLSFNYLKESKLGVALVVLATLFVKISVPFNMIALYGTTLFGYLIIFFTLFKSNLTKTNS